MTGKFVHRGTSPRQEVLSVAYDSDRPGFAFLLQSGTGMFQSAWAENYCACIPGCSRCPITEKGGST